MSNNNLANNCHKKVPKIDLLLDNFSKSVYKSLQSKNKTIKLNLRDQQKCLFLAYFNLPKTRKIFITEENIRNCQITRDIINTFCKSLNVKNNWHAIYDNLSEAEMSGQISTPLSRTYRLLLSEKTNCHFIIPISLLEHRSPDLAWFKQNKLSVVRGETLTPKELAEKLIALGYIRNLKAVESGGFCLRGENIIIKNPDYNKQHRITFFRNQIEQIITRGKKNKDVKNLVLSPLAVKPDGSWQDFFTNCILFQPYHLSLPTNQPKIIINSPTPQTKFPLNNQTFNPDLARSLSTTIFYTNFDLIKNYLQKAHLKSSCLEPSPLAKIDFCFQYESNLFVSEKAIFPKKTTGKPISYKQALNKINQLKTGQPAVHTDHGIGIFEGLAKKTIKNTIRDYLVIRYAAGDTLSVPVQYANKITPYTGPESPPINRLHDPTWKKTRKKAQHNAAAFARELLSTAQIRHQASRDPYPLTPTLSQKIKNQSPYALTPDQKKAWQDIEKDLLDTKPMDRLVVGDVGFGKTEIAIRTAYAVSICKHQVALLCPTTLLAQQHYEAFIKRLPKISSRITLLSRFNTPKEKRNTYEAIKNNRSKIIIGTSSLLSPHIKWCEPGLIIIDEEQRFGVKQKEYFKKIRNSIDVLSLTATPIPRTLYLSLSGLKCLSVINTPPPGRKNIKTSIQSFQEKTIGHAISRELKRRGQVLAVTPRIRNIPHLFQKIQAASPQARLAIAHAQLPDKKLAETMRRFYLGKIDILLCTTIIASGLDMPNTNTILVFNSPNYGLADLYQLRGRVGRRQRQAHAYFLYHQKKLTPVQKKRMAALIETSHLGSGWQLARHDLAIRGAGNILGREQSGAIQSVGLSFYLNLVQEQIAKTKKEAPITKNIDIHLPLTTTIPNHYIADINKRINWYQRLSRALSLKILTQETNTLKKTYGPIPPETKQLILSIKLELAAAKHNITSINSAKVNPPNRKPFFRLSLTGQRLAPMISKLAPDFSPQIKDSAIIIDVNKINHQLIKKLYQKLK